MLPKAQRLRSRRDFDAVYAAGNIFHTRLFKISTRKTAHTTTRFGVVVSNTVAKLAVDRNTKKRQIRAILGKFSHSESSHDVVITLKKQGVASTFQELSTDLEYGLRKARV